MNDDEDFYRFTLGNAGPFTFTARLTNLIHTVDQTILYLKGKTDMSQSQLFEGFSEEKQQYIEQASRTSARP